MVSVLYNVGGMLQMWSSFFACFDQVWKLQYMVEPEIKILVFILCFVCNPYPGCMAVMMTI